MEKRFRCTACGQCCYGWIPLTLADAFRHAGRFPLAMIWTVVPQTARAFGLTSTLGFPLKLGKRGRMAVSIVPTAYLPPTMSCPELLADGRCAIHDSKPLRCRAMPFYAFRDEQDQAEGLKPRKGWACDTSADAPVVYRDGRIADRADFDAERAELLAQVPAIRAYGEYVLKYMPWMTGTLESLARKPGGNMVAGISAFLTATRSPDAATLAARQLPVLRDFAARTADASDLAEYHRNYAGWAKEMEYLAAPPARS
jgi:Fe-S-cluster containining protein